jgi:acetyl-CoA/propionyl-CoA carboxylase biotin carboxyl carrier protein
VSYQSVGTVEFLVDVTNDTFYFLEMNTRLQVEHGVTELVTGIDLVAAQLRVASGTPLGLHQSDIHVSGHAIEVRIAAEDPQLGFRAAPGTLRTVRQPTGPWVRSDFGVESGDSVSGYYDSMFGKIMAWGADRDLARRRLANALGELFIDGLPTTAPYLRQLLDEPTFVACRHHTASIERDWAPNPGRYIPAKISLPSAIDAGANHMQLSVRTVEIPWGASSNSVAVYGVVPEVSPATVASTRTNSGGAIDLMSRGEGAHLVAAPMDAVVVQTPVIAGATVSKGEVLAILEAMKMEVIIRSPRDGVVATVHVSAGDTVQSGSILAALEVTAP